MTKDQREFIEIEQKIRSDVLPSKNNDKVNKEEFTPGPSEIVSTNNNQVKDFLNSKLEQQIMNGPKNHSSIEVFLADKKAKTRRDPKLRKKQKLQGVKASNLDVAVATVQV